MKLTLSKHATTRMNQRGIRKVDIELLIMYADIVIPCGNGGASYSMTQKGREDLLRINTPVQIVDRIGNICAIVSWDGIVVTTMKLRGDRGKRYRRDKQNYRRKNSEMEDVKWAM